MRCVADFAPHQILLECSSNVQGSDGGMWPIGGKTKGACRVLVRKYGGKTQI
jgi:hypothetical protein